MANDGKRVRIRRTKATIIEDIRKAAVESVLKRGFSGSLVSEIIKKAKVEPVVFYNRYQNLEEFFSEFVKGMIIGSLMWRKKQTNERHHTINLSH